MRSNLVPSLDKRHITIVAGVLGVLVAFITRTGVLHAWRPVNLITLIISSQAYLSLEAPTSCMTLLRHLILHLNLQLIELSCADWCWGIDHKVPCTHSLGEGNNVPNGISA